MCSNYNLLMRALEDQEIKFLTICFRIILMMILPTHNPKLKYTIRGRCCR